MNHRLEHYHFVTGRLAEPSVRAMVAELAQQLNFEFSISVLPITVAALMNANWLLKHLVTPVEATQLILPGYLDRELPAIQNQIALPVHCGPKNIRDLPQFFGLGSRRTSQYGGYSIEIIAEINHADRLNLHELLATAQQLKLDGADVIDLGCSPDNCWSAIGVAVKELKQLGLRVSVDSFNPTEVAQACRAGAELVLSVNSQNCSLAQQWGAEVVVVPDTPDNLESLHRTVEYLENRSIAFRIDPILEPIGLGFARSLERYAVCRRHYPEAAMMMGIGNITELTDADSAGINTVLLGFCEELEIRSVLTTQVINWARSSVRECDLARRLVHYAVQQQTPPKHLEPNLIMLRSPRLTEFTEETIAQIGEAIKDNNFRIFTAGGQIHAVTGGLHARGNDPFEVMQLILDSPIANKIDPTHAFYLGFEMCKALQAITLSKTYEQDEALPWGYLTRTERHWRLKPTRKSDASR
jgi:dihydropteroate synthase-like protein